MWSPPRTWNFGETVTASLYNAHVRDDFNILKTNVDDAGFPRLLLFGSGSSAGGAQPGINANEAGGGDTLLTGFEFTIPANFLAQPGDGLLLEGTFATTVGEQKTAKFKVGDATIKMLFGTIPGASDIIPVTFCLRRRQDSAKAAMTGFAWIGAPAAGQPAPYLLNTGVNDCDWTVAQVFRLYLAAATAGSIRLTEFHAMPTRGIEGFAVP